MRVASSILFAFLATSLVAMHTAQGATRFSFAHVIQEARAAALHAYLPPPRAPEFLSAISYDQYQAIRFIPANSLWHGSGRNFQVQPVPLGLYYMTPVAIAIVRNGSVQPLRFSKRDFTYPSGAFSRRLPRHSGYAGFKLTFPLTVPGIQNQFLVFAGASYFRAVGRPNHFGLSARAIAVDTAFPPGEEFPAFRKFWLLEPKHGAASMTVYALLDGSSVTGAYRFQITPGGATRIAVQAALFFRKTPRVVGIAPLTSMFFFGAGTPRPAGEWRPAVHDSDGLQMENGDGEWLWRPLLNPVHFLVSSFALDDPVGFGLMQREQRFSAYQDLGARYDLRPSAWVIPANHWGRGHIELVEIPASSETMDNIVAYWVPRQPAQPGREYRYAYRVLFGRAGVARPPAGYVRHTFIGSGPNPGMPCDSAKNTLRFVVDFGGKFPPGRGAVHAAVSADRSARVSRVSVMRNRAAGGYRLSFLVRVQAERPLELRAFLQRGRNTLTETWSYLLPWSNARPLLQTPGCPGA